MEGGGKREGTGGFWGVRPSSSIGRFGWLAWWWIYFKLSCGVEATRMPSKHVVCQANDQAWFRWVGNFDDDITVLLEVQC